MKKQSEEEVHERNLINSTKIFKTFQESRFYELERTWVRKTIQKGGMEKERVWM